MVTAVDLYWSFRSPYCYLALDRLLTIEHDLGVHIRLRPVYPMAVRDPDFFKRTNPLYRPYHTLDSRRLAEFLGVPFRRPVPDPIVMDMKTSAIAADQPYIRRVTRLGQAAAMEGRGMAFLDQVARLIWDGGTDNWHQGSHLADAMRRAGLDADALDTAIKRDPETYDKVIHENETAQTEAGHWGVPLMVLDGEPFYGQDRIDLLVWRLTQKGT